MTSFVFVVSGTTTGAPPGDYQSTGSNWDTIAAGGSGGKGQSTVNQAAGGGGGGFSRISGVAWSAAQTCSIGTGGAAQSTANTDGNTGGDTWVRIDGGGTAPATTAQGCLAKGGGGGGHTGTAGAGGPTATGVGTTKNAGGAGGAESNTDNGNTGGGGAGGPGGAGGAGGADTGNGAFSGGTGGGANGGGGNGVANSAATGTAGTAGGASITTGNQVGQAGGTTNTAPTTANAGTQGSGGGGGSGTTTASNAGAGGAGGPGTEYDSTHGSGGGGGGGADSSGGGAAAAGGAGGNYGGGGGGAGANSGAGDGGLLAIGYTPSSSSPFSLEDFSKPFFPKPIPASFQATNLNLFKNPIPFGPFDWNKPAQPYPYRVSATWPTNINLFKNPIPIFNPFIQPPALFGPSAPQPTFQATLTLTANLGPWTQTDFSKPSAYLSNKPIDGAGTNINLYPNPIPVIPFDWNKPALPYLPQPRVEGTNINLFTNPIPFGPYDWPRPALFQPAPPPASQATPLVQFANLGPFTQPQPPPVWRCPAAPAIALPSNIALLTATAATAPVIPYDFSKPYFPSVATDKTQPTNINLLTNPVPFAQTDWPRTYFNPSIPAENFYLMFFPAAPFIPVDMSQATPPRISAPHPYTINIALTTATAGGTPFVQRDWSRSYFGPIVPADQHLLMFFPAAPIVPVDMSYARRLAPSAPHPYTLNIALTTTATAGVPFVQTDWPRAYSSPSLPAENFYLMLFPAAPFVPVDTSYAFKPLPSAPHPYTVNIALTSVPPPPMPFGPYDYNRQFQVRPERPRSSSDGTNINLFANPIPFFNSMDFRSPARPQWRTWDQGPPNMVLLTTPPPTPPATTEQPPYFFNLSFGKLSGF